MKYALTLDNDNRILCATFLKYAYNSDACVDELPNGNITDYLYVDGEFVYEPIVEEEKASESISYGERIAAIEAALLELAGVEL